MQNTGQKRSRHAPPETSNPEDKAVKAWTQLTRRLLVVLMPLQYLFEHLLETIMGAQSQRRVLARLIENMSDEELHHVTKMAKDEMNRRGELVGHLHRDQRSGTTLGRIPEEGSEGDFGENSALRPDRQPAGDRDADRTPTSLPMRPTGEDSSEHRGQPRGGDLLPMPEVPGTTVRVQTMDPMPAIERCDQLEVPPATRRKAQVLCRGAGGMVQEICPHSSTHRKGSNAFLTKVTCRYCNKVIRQEKKAVVTETASPSSPSETLPRPSTPTPTSPQEGMTEPEDYQDFMDFLRWRRMKGPSSQ